ncbi:hypothetical protein [Saccharothrix hoggarensis]|uniref:Uncharacterized protein n=1 Tax=Saccharothrix hoggarensis TaxID=913853 RepID=A0ABW3QMF4_9PSEU
MGSGLSRALAFVLFVGAARADAIPSQLARFRAELPPLLGGFRETGDERPVRELIRDVMGADWRPAAEWRDAISAATGTPP